MTIDVRAFDAATAKWEKTDDIAAAQEAITLYRGSLLEGFDAPFLEGERHVREQTCLTLLEAVASHALTHGDPERAALLARRAETLDPLRQSAQRLLYQSLTAQGDRPAAERAYRNFRIRLRRETGQESDAALKKALTSPHPRLLSKRPSPSEGRGGNRRGCRGRTCPYPSCRAGTSRGRAGTSPAPTQFLSGSPSPFRGGGALRKQTGVGASHFPDAPFRTAGRNTAGTGDAAYG